jgi:peroxiredoxin
MAATETTDLDLGFTAPDFSLPNATEEGMVHAKDVFAGRPTLVVFMCNHCPFVIHLLESFV